MGLDLGPIATYSPGNLFTSALPMVLGEQRKAEILRTPVGRPGPLAAQSSIESRVARVRGTTKVAAETKIVLSGWRGIRLDRAARIS